MGVAASEGDAVAGATFGTDEAGGSAAPAACDEAGAVCGATGWFVVVWARQENDISPNTKVRNTKLKNTTFERRTRNMRTLWPAGD